MSDVEIEINGNDLIKIGYKEGPIISEALKDVKKEVLKGKLVTKEKQLEHADKIKDRLERK